MLTAPAFIGGIPGGMEFAIILLLAVLLFGANKIPKLARSTGQSIGEFQKGREEVEQELQEIREGGSTEDNTETDTVAEPSTESDPVTESSTASDSDDTKTN